MRQNLESYCTILIKTGHLTEKTDHRSYYVISTVSFIGSKNLPPMAFNCSMLDLALRCSGVKLALALCTIRSVSRLLLRDDLVFFEPDFQRHILIFRSEITARTCPSAQQLLTNWVTVVENLWWNCYVIHRTQPPISISIEEPFPRDLRLVAAAGMPELPIKEDRIPRLATDSHRTFGQGAIAGFIEGITEVATRNNIEIAPPRFRAIRQPVDNFK